MSSKKTAPKKATAKPTAKPVKKVATKAKTKAKVTAKIPQAIQDTHASLATFPFPIIFAGGEYIANRTLEELKDISASLRAMLGVKETLERTNELLTSFNEYYTNNNSEPESSEEECQECDDENCSCHNTDEVANDE